MYIIRRKLYRRRRLWW